MVKGLHSQRTLLLAHVPGGRFRRTPSGCISGMTRSMWISSGHSPMARNLGVRDDNAAPSPKFFPRGA